MLWKESYDQPRWHIKKQRHYFAKKGPSSQGYGFSMVMYGCESWTVKKAERRRIDVFELWCWLSLALEHLCALGVCFGLVQPAVLQGEFAMDNSGS